MWRGGSIHRDMLIRPSSNNAPLFLHFRAEHTHTKVRTNGTEIESNQKVFIFAESLLNIE